MSSLPPPTQLARVPQRRERLATARNVFFVHGLSPLVCPFGSVRAYIGFAIKFHIKNKGMCYVLIIKITAIFIKPHSLLNICFFYPLKDAEWRTKSLLSENAHCFSYIKVTDEMIADFVYSVCKFTFSLAVSNF